MLVLLIKTDDFEKRNTVTLQFAMKLGILLAFQNLQEANWIFKMAVSDGLKEIRIMFFRTITFFYLISDFIGFEAECVI